MPVVKDNISVSTKGDAEILDITGKVSAAVGTSGLGQGTVTVFVPGSTAGITTIEYEPGLLKDLPEAFERLAASGRRYAHDDTWHDGNGHAHVRAALLGPSLTVPFDADGLTLGTWQQIVLIDFDNKSRRRELVLQMIGE